MDQRQKQQQQPTQEAVSSINPATPYIVTSSSEKAANPAHPSSSQNRSSDSSTAMATTVMIHPPPLASTSALAPFTFPKRSSNIAMTAGAPPMSSRLPYTSTYTSSAESYQVLPVMSASNTSSTATASTAATATATTSSSQAQQHPPPLPRVIKRIRHCHAHDVLSGRGGSVNSHEGNVKFRAWVAERKNRYNLARHKAEKAAVAREVIVLVQSQTPPGRFLTKDLTSSSLLSKKNQLQSSGSNSSILLSGAGVVVGGGGGGGWWVELDDDRILAKTAQALREGAPLIRSEHADELGEPINIKQQREKRNIKSTAQSPLINNNSIKNDGSRMPSLAATGIATTTTTETAATTASSLPAQVVTRRIVPAAKRLRVEAEHTIIHPNHPINDATPPTILTDLPPLDDHRIFPNPPAVPTTLTTSTNSIIASETMNTTLSPYPTPPKLKRAHSLALFENTNNDSWNFDDNDNDVFIDPFHDENEDVEGMMGGDDDYIDYDDNETTFSNLPEPPRRGARIFDQDGRVTSSSSNSDMGGLSSLLMTTTTNTTHNPSSSSSMNHHSTTRNHNFRSSAEKRKRLMMIPDPLQVWKEEYLASPQLIQWWEYPLTWDGEVSMPTPRPVSPN